MENENNSLEKIARNEKIEIKSGENIKYIVARDSEFLVKKDGHLEIVTAKNCKVSLELGGTYHIETGNNVEVINLNQSEITENKDEKEALVLENMSNPDKEYFEILKKAEEIYSESVEISLKQIDRLDNDFFQNLSANQIQEIIENSKLVGNIKGVFEEAQENIELDLETLNTMTDLYQKKSFKEKIDFRKNLKDGLSDYYEKLSLNPEELNNLKELVYQMSRQAERYEMIEVEAKLKFPEIYQDLEQNSHLAKEILKKTTADRSPYESEILELEFSKAMLKSIEKNKEELLKKYNK